MGSLAGQYISQSYQSLIHLGSDSTISSSYTDLQDGFGNTLNISVNAQGDISASGNIFAANLATITYDTGSLLTTASFNNSTRNLTFTKGNNTTFNVNIPDVSGSTIPAGTVSGSAQIAALGFISSSVTSSMAVSSSLYAVTASLAREVIVSAINANQSTLPIGTVVRISGANGDNPQFNTASFLDETNSSNTLGILANTAVSGQYGDVTVIGKLVGVNTAGMNAGDLIYLSSSGQFTNVQPQAPLQIVVLGEVLRVQQNNGSIFVNVSNGWELNELHNVRITNPLQGDVLVYEASSSLWKNVPSSSITPTDISALNTFTASIAGTNTFTASVAGTNAFTASIAGTNAFTASVAGTNAFTASIAGTNAFTASIAGTNAFTQSANSRLNSIEAQSGSWVTSAITASTLVTASVNVNILTFTKGNGTTFDLVVSASGSVVPGTISGSAQISAFGFISGSTVNTGSLATTGSNSFVGNQIISGGLLVSSSANPIGFSGSSFRVETVGGIVFKPGTDIAFQGNTVFTNPGRFPIVNVDNSGSNGYYGFNNEIVGRIYQDFSGSVNSRLNAAATTGSNTFTGTQTIQQTLKINESNPLPAGEIGMLAVSASNLYFYSGSSWNKIAFA